jgi:D-cysteine desulfhydrase
MAFVTASEKRRGHRPFVMVPGGATPAGALGYVGAAFELALQIEQGALPRPGHVVVGVGSTCTSAGLLLGFCLASRLGRAFADAAGRPAPPVVVAVRVTPWPVTSVTRIVGLAVRASRLLAELAGEPGLALTRRELSPYLHVDGSQLGRGYGFATEAGRAATEAFRAAGGPTLDGTYSEKAAAGFLEVARVARPGNVLFWATKSSAALPPVSGGREGGGPWLVRRFIEREEQAARSRLGPQP